VASIRWASGYFRQEHHHVPNPILAIRDFRRKVSDRRVPSVAISPIVRGKAVKRPTAKLMHELGIMTTSRSIADHDEELIDGIIVDAADAGEAAAIGMPVLQRPSASRSGWHWPITC